MGDKILLNNNFLKFYFGLAIISSIILSISYASVIGITNIAKSGLMRNVSSFAEYGMYVLSLIALLTFIKHKTNKTLLIVPAVYLLTLFVSLGYMAFSAVIDITDGSSPKYDQNGLIIYEMPNYLTNTGYINIFSSGIILIVSLYVLSTLGKTNYFSAGA